MIRKFTTSAADAGRPLAMWLADRLNVAPAEARRRVESGAVSVDGVRTRGVDVPLAAGQRIAVHPEVESRSGPGSGDGGLVVVHVDPSVIVVDKPPGLPTTAPRAGGRSLDALVAAAYPGATVVHRLDRDTSGLVLFARTRAARQDLSAALADHTLERVYLAAVLGSPGADDLRLDAPVRGAEALSLAHVVRRAAGRTLLEVRLVTGRTHQIRIHLSGVGLPILGDPLYGGPAARLAARLALHATRLGWQGGGAMSPLPSEIAALVA